jgi:hypothetical protein
MNTLKVLLEDGLILEAIEFGREAHFTVITRLQGQRRQRIHRFTLNQLNMLLAAMEQQGETLANLIDEMYEYHRNDYEVHYKGKQLRIDTKSLFGNPYVLSEPPMSSYAA